MNIVLDELTQSDTLLSIITVCRNDVDRLSQTIDSMLQFYGDSRFEHILMDGVSTDQTAQMVGRLSAASNFQFHSEADKGIYDAMNHGTAKSKGKFLLFLNCGDRMSASPDEIAGWIKIQSEENTADIICFAFAQVEAGGSTRIVPAKNPTRHQMPTSHQAMIFAADFVRAHGYDVRYKIAADFDLYMHSQLEAVVLSSAKEPLTAVEVDGVASSQPMISYREYLLIASRNLQGLEMLTCSLRIGTKALVVIILKSLLPPTWISKLRRVS